jgi:hypothetical protein
MSRHPFSRRKRRRIHAGAIKYHPTYEAIPGKPGAMRVRWGPTDMRPGGKNAASGYRYRRRAPWHTRLSSVPKRMPLTPVEYERRQMEKRWEDLEKFHREQSGAPPASRSPEGGG